MLLVIKMGGSILKEGASTDLIADLKEVDVNLQLEDREGVDSKGITFKYKVVIVEGIEYRVPASVLGNLKAILLKKSTNK